MCNALGAAFAATASAELAKELTAEVKRLLLEHKGENSNEFKRAYEALFRDLDDISAVIRGDRKVAKRILKLGPNGTDEVWAELSAYIYVFALAEDGTLDFAYLQKKG